MGETGPIADGFNVQDTSVQYQAADGLKGTTVILSGTTITREVDAKGTMNTFNIMGAGVSGPSGDLVGDSGTNEFTFDAGGHILGNIRGGGKSTLNYEPYSAAEIVFLQNGTNGSATGVSGTVSGITAVIGSNLGGPVNDQLPPVLAGAFNWLNAGSVPGVTLTGGLGENIIMGDGAGDSVAESIASSYTFGTARNTTFLTDASLNFIDWLGGITVVNLTGTSLFGDSFNVSDWTGTGSLTGHNISSVTASESADITLTNSSLTSGTMSMSLNGIASADLTVTAATGHPSLTINASAFSGPTNLIAAGTVDATLYGGSGGGGTLTATGSGNDILIGEAADTTLTDTGSGRNILIGGGAGGDTLRRRTATTSWSAARRSTTANNGANLTALDAILAEWTSSDSYTARIRRIKLASRHQGFRRSDAFNAHTIQPDGTANTLSDRNIVTNRFANALVRPKLSFRRISPLPVPLPQSHNWFIASSQDHVTKRPNETKTII